MPQVSSLDDYAPSTITRVYGVNGEVVGEFATQRRVVITYDQISPLLRQAIVSAEDQDFDSHLGLSIPRIVVTVVKDLVRGQRAGASTLTQQLARNLFLTNEKTLGSQAQGSAPHDSDREALHQARDLHALLQSHSLGPWHLRRRGRLPPLLRQVGEGPDARRSGAAGRHHPGAVAAEPLREHRRARRGGGTTRCSGWPRKASSPQARADQAKQAPIVTAGRPSAGGFARVLPRGGQAAPRRALRRQAALRERPGRLHVDRPVAAARGGSGVRCRPAQGGQAARLPQAGAQRHRRRQSLSRRGTTERWKGPMAVGDIVPAVVLGRESCAQGGASRRPCCCARAR